MSDKIEKVIKSLLEGKSNTTLLFQSKKVDTQLNIAQAYTRKILKIPSDKSYKTHPDVLGIWPEHISGRTIKIDQIHNLIRRLQLKPYIAKYKVGIIISAEKMNKESQNALLKTLEEPPKKTYILLTTSNKEKLLPTILSRCKIVELKKDSEDEIDLNLVREILSKDIVSRFKLVERITKQKNKNKMNEELDNLCDNLLLYLSSALKKSGKKPESIINLIELVETTQTAIEKNVNKRLALENLMINIPLKNIDF